MIFDCGGWQGKMPDCTVMWPFCRKHVVFGKLVQGHNVLKKIEEFGDEEGHPTVTVKIINCGEYSEGGKSRHRGNL